MPCSLKPGSFRYTRAYAGTLRRQEHPPEILEDSPSARKRPNGQDTVRSGWSQKVSQPLHSPQYVKRALPEPVCTLRNRWQAADTQRRSRYVHMSPHSNHTLTFRQVYDSMRQKEETFTQVSTNFLVYGQCVILFRGSAQVGF